MRNRNANWASTGVGFSLVALMALVAKPLIRIWATPSAVANDLLHRVVEYLCDDWHSPDAYKPILSGVEKVTPLAISTTLCAVG